MKHGCRPGARRRRLWTRGVQLRLGRSEMWMEEALTEASEYVPTVQERRVDAKL